MNSQYKMLRIVWLMIAVTSIFFVTSCGGVFFPLPYRSLAPFKGKVVDADTKEPIEGAVVLGVYYFTAYTIAGSNSYVEDGQETLTDKNGEFKLPRTRRWFVLHRGYPEGRLEIFKPGYGTLWHQRSIAVGDNKSWPTPSKYIVYELPRLINVEDRKKNVRSARRYDEIPYRNKRQYWEKVNEECSYVGIPPMTMTEKERNK